MATKLSSKSSAVQRTVLKIFSTYSISVLLPHVSYIDKCVEDSDRSVRLAALRVVEQSGGTWEHFDADKIVSLLGEDVTATRVLVRFSRKGWLSTQRLVSILFKSRSIFEPGDHSRKLHAAFEAFLPGASRYFSSLSTDEIVTWMRARVEGQDPDRVRTQFGVEFHKSYLRSGPQCVTTKPNLVAAAVRWLDSHASALIVSIKVRGQTGSETFFKIKRSSPLKRLMEVWAQRQGATRVGQYYLPTTPSAYRFIFDGNRIADTETPDDLDMENDDVHSLEHQSCTPHVGAEMPLIFHIILLYLTSGR
jgi:hypothetical protein